MKKRYMAIMVLAVMLISAAGCNNASQTMPEEEISIVSTGLESTNTNEKNIDDVLNEIGQNANTDNAQSVQQTEQESSQNSEQQESSQQTEQQESSQKPTVKERSKMTTPAQENSVEENNSQISENTDTQSSATQKSNKSESSVQKPSSSNSSTVTANYTSSTGGILDTADIFSDRDLTQTPDLSNAQTITVSDGQTINITEEGIYVISGSASNCTIKVDTQDKVQLVLNGVSITNDSTPAIYVVSADKCFITTAENTENTLSVTGTFTSDGDTNTDAVIFSKDDLVFNGLGTLTINSSNNGISCKDDLKFTGGTYNITSVEDSIEANDSIAVCDGMFTINSSKDAFHSENDDDNTSGWIYISGGTFNIKSSSDAIQGTSAVQIDGGTLDINSSEGIEATYIQINDGTVKIYASDDGINATKKSTAYSTPTIEINGGNLTVEVGPGDTDGIDANGDIIVNGGTINVTAQMSSFDYDGKAEYNGGTIIVNGTQVDSIPQSMMGGGRGGMMMPGGMQRGDRMGF